MGHILDSFENKESDIKQRMLLMNKDDVILSFSILGTGDLEYCDIQVVHREVPFPASKLGDWISNRSAVKHREHIRRIFDSIGGNTISNIIKLTHCLSLVDTLWVKSENENISWSDINLYDNNFDEVISVLAFEGSGLFGDIMSSTSPELTTNGQFDKCWVREDSGIYLLKAGSIGARNTGLEPYSEVLASQVYNKLVPDSVEYTLSRFRGRVVSKCKLFTSQECGYMPAGSIVESNQLGYLLNKYESFGDGDNFRRMICADAVTLNRDRHLGNFGFIVDNSSYQLLGINPCFDFNLAFTPLAELDIDFIRYNEYLYQYPPCIGSGYVSAAKSVLTSGIRSDLINLKSLDLSIECDDKFTKERLQAINDIKDTMIARVLGEQKQFAFSKDNMLEV